MLSRLVRLMSSLSRRPRVALASSGGGPWPRRAAPAGDTRSSHRPKLKMWISPTVGKTGIEAANCDFLETIYSCAQTLYPGIAASLSALIFSVDAQLLLAHAPRDDHPLGAGANSEPTGFSLLAESDLEGA